MKNNKNLNPLNDPEVAEMLTMSSDDQLWSFLDDCVPYDGRSKKNDRFYFSWKIEKEAKEKKENEDKKKDSQRNEKK